MACYVLVRGGLEAVEAALEGFRRSLYRYNSLLRGSGYYLKPVHIVTRRLADGSRRRYMYIGRYWWRLSYTRGRGAPSHRLAWRYVGRDMPAELRGKVPPPPRNPLEGLSYAALEGGDILLRVEVYDRFSWVFEGLPVERVGCEEAPRRVAGERRRA